MASQYAQQLRALPFQILSGAVFTTKFCTDALLRRAAGLDCAPSQVTESVKAATVQVCLLIPPTASF